MAGGPPPGYNSYGDPYGGPPMRGGVIVPPPPPYAGAGGYMVHWFHCVDCECIVGDRNEFHSFGFDRCVMFCNDLMLVNCAGNATQRP